jgi:hypothetical protein
MNPALYFCILLTARVCTSYFKSKGKAIPNQAWIDPYGSRRLKLPEFLDIRHMKVAGCHPCVPAALTIQEISLVLTFVRGLVDPMAKIRPQ